MIKPLFAHIEAYKNSLKISMRRQPEALIQMEEAYP
jgi:hypothetical protein